MRVLLAVVFVAMGLAACAMPQSAADQPPPDQDLGSVASQNTGDTMSTGATWSGGIFGAVH